MSFKKLLSIGLAVLFISAPLDAKPGKGGGAKKGGFGKGPSRTFSPGSNKGAKSFSPQGRGKSGLDKINRGNGNGIEKLVGRDRAVSVQRLNETSKLQHRQQTAQKLRDISARNGNENLNDVADRMDQRALDHFEKRNQKIDELAGRGTEAPFDQNALADPFERPLTEEQISKLNDPALRQQHRVLNEERKLEHQLDVAQKLRDLSAKNGNQNLLQTAERMELMAAERYASQLDKILSPAPLVAPVTTSPVPVTAPLVP